MKRHLDLYRTLLLELETHEKPGMHYFDFEAPGYSEAQVMEHLKLLIDAGYMEGRYFAEDGPVKNAYARNLTDKGFDFLLDIRNDGVWERTKERVREVTGTASIAVVKQIATEIASGRYS